MATNNISFTSKNGFSTMANSTISGTLTTAAISFTGGGNITSTTNNLQISSGSSTGLISFNQGTIQSAFIDASGNLTANVLVTGGTTTRSLANHFSDMVSVKDYTATGNGVTNDAPAFTLAHSLAPAGAALYIPSGTYLLNSTVTLTNRIVISDGAVFTGTGSIAGAMIETRQSGSRLFNTAGSGYYPSWYAFGRNDGALAQGLVIGGGNPHDGMYGTNLRLDGWLGWCAIQPTKNESEQEVCIYSSSSGGFATANSGTSTISWVSGTPFNTSAAGVTDGWIGRRFYLGANTYQITSVTSGSLLTVSYIAGPATLPFSSSFTEVYQVVDTRGSGTCNVNGTSVTRIAGDPFIVFTSYPFVFYLNGTSYTVSSWNSVDSLTLSSSAGTLTGVNYYWSTTVYDQVTALRVQKVTGTNEENLTIGARGNGRYFINSLVAGSGSYRPIYMGSGSYATAGLRSQIVVQSTGDLTLGGDYGYDTLRIAGSLGTLAATANYVLMQPCYTGYNPGFAARGTDSNLGLAFDAQGTGAYSFTSGSYGYTEFKVFAGQGNAFLSAASGTNKGVLAVNSGTNSILQLLAGSSSGAIQLTVNTTNILTATSGGITIAGSVLSGNTTIAQDWSEVRLRALSTSNLNSWRMTGAMNGTVDGPITIQHSTDNFNSNFLNGLVIDNVTGNITLTGAIVGATTATFSGNIQAASATVTGTLKAASATIGGALQTASATISGALAVGGNIGFNGTAPVAKPTISGSRGSQTASVLNSLLNALASMGLIINSTTT